MPRDTRSAYMRLVEKLEPDIRRAFRQSIADIVDSAVLIDIEAAIGRGDVEAIMRVLNLSPEFFAPLDRAISETFRAGAIAQLATVPKRPIAKGASRVIVRFNGRHPRAEALILEQVTKLSGEILDDQRTLIRNVLNRGLTESLSRRETVLDLVGRRNAAGKRSGGLVGLTSQQDGTVQKAKAILTDPNRIQEYFVKDRITGELKPRFTKTNRTFDGIVKKAIKSGKALSNTKANQITRHYSNALLKQRGKTIARTETHAALNKGKAEAVDQLIDNGKVTNEMVTKIWDATTGSGRTRDTHIRLNGQQREKALPFNSSSGARLMYPHDPNAPRAETINCRCSVRYRIDYLQQAR